MRRAFDRNMPMQTDSNVHIGSLIKAELKNQGRSVSWFADRLCYERSNIYRIFRSKSIDTETLFRISKILNVNFFSNFRVD